MFFRVYQMEDDMMGGACSMCTEGEKCVVNFVLKIRRKDTICEMKA
jgi:hypothetical protein